MKEVLFMAFVYVWGFASSAMLLYVIVCVVLNFLHGR